MVGLTLGAEKLPLLLMAGVYACNFENGRDIGHFALPFKNRMRSCLSLSVIRVAAVVPCFRVKFTRNTTRTFVRLIAPGSVRPGLIPRFFGGTTTACYSNAPQAGLRMLAVSGGKDFGEHPAHKF